MRVVVDRDLCESHAMCMATAPEIFELGDDDVLHILVDVVPAELTAKVDEAIMRCPKQALSLAPS